MRPIDADAIKLERGFFENIDNVPKFFEWLGKQPTVDLMKWTPVSEGMPNQNKQFLVQYKNGEMDVVYCSDVNPFWTNLKTDWHWVGTVQFAKVVAWMPLPKPWKGE